jgi:hypothetical protein
MNDTDVLYYCAVLFFFFFCNFLRTDSRVRLSEVGGGEDGEGGEREEEGGANINIDD